MSNHEVPRPGGWLRPSPAPTATVDDPPTGDLAIRLAGLPVAEHADVLAAEHDRLHRLLATVDQL